MYCSCWLVVLFFCFFYWRIGTLPCIIATVNTLCSWRKLESHCLVITACVCMFANTLIEDMAPTIVCRSPSSAVAEFKCGEVRVAPGRLMKLNHTYTCTLKSTEAALPACSLPDFVCFSSNVFWCSCSCCLSKPVQMILN